MELASVPGLPELVRRHRGGRKRGRGLRLEEPEPLGEFRRDEVSQGHVIDEHNEPDRGGGLLREHAIATSPVMTAISASKSIP